MSTFTATVPQATLPPKKVAQQSPGSIAIRLGAFLVAIVAVSAFGPALLSRAIHGPKDTYTLVLKTDVPTSRAVASLKDSGYDISAVEETAAGTAVVAQIASRDADGLFQNEDVAFVQTGQPMRAQHSFLETVTQKLGF